MSGGRVNQVLRRSLFSHLCRPRPCRLLTGSTLPMPNLDRRCRSVFGCLLNLPRTRIYLHYYYNNNIQHAVGVHCKAFICDHSNLSGYSLNIFDLFSGGGAHVRAHYFSPPLILSYTDNMTFFIIFETAFIFSYFLVIFD